MQRFAGIEPGIGRGRPVRPCPGYWGTPAGRRAFDAWCSPRSPSAAPSLRNAPGLRGRTAVTPPLWPRECVCRDRTCAGKAAVNLRVQRGFGRGRRVVPTARASRSTTMTSSMPSRPCFAARHGDGRVVGIKASVAARRRRPATQGQFTAGIGDRFGTGCAGVRCPCRERGEVGHPAIGHQAGKVATIRDSGGPRSADAFSESPSRVARRSLRSSRLRSNRCRAMPETLDPILVAIALASRARRARVRLARPPPSRATAWRGCASAELVALREQRDAHARQLEDAPAGVRTRRSAARSSSAGELRAGGCFGTRARSAPVRPAGRRGIAFPATATCAARRARHSEPEVPSEREPRRTSWPCSNGPASACAKPSRASPSRSSMPRPKLPGSKCRTAR